MTRFEILTLVATVVLATISLVALVRKRQTTERELEQEAQEERARQLANVSIYVGETVDDFRFFIHNAGPADALNVAVDVTYRAGGGSPVLSQDRDEKLPIARLRAGQEVNLMATVPLERQRSFRGVATWQTAAGESGRWEGDLFA